MIDVREFDYELPEELIAQHPCAERDKARLLVIEKDAGKIIHKKFYEVGEFLRPGDLLVINNTRVIKARLLGHKEGGSGKVEIFLLEEIGKNRFRVLARPGKRLKVGDSIAFGETYPTARVTEDLSKEKVIQFDTDEDIKGLLDDMGAVPLPPYIKRDAAPSDEERYQTVYAKKAGAVAAPTAGFHFTKELIDKLKSDGVKFAELTLHVGYGSFSPVRTVQIEEHKLEPERFTITEETARLINKARSSGGRVIAVGTSSCRALEASAADGKIKAGEGKTGLFIYPPYEFKIVDALITNFHLPRTTLIMLVSAFCEKEMLFRTYREAVDKRYRFYSFGDAMLII